MDITRRGFLGGLGAGALATTLPLASALAAAGDLRFLFVFNQGGWDPTQVFAPVFDNPNVAMEPDAELGNCGGISLVEHPLRPSVSSYFAEHHGSTVILNGVSVGSLSHESCTRRMLTGRDRGALLGAVERSRSLLLRRGLGDPSSSRGAAARRGELEGSRLAVDIPGDRTIRSQGEEAVEALSRGISRCVSVASPAAWDTHTNNNQTQSALFENLFGGLLDIQNRLRDAPGHTAPTLADETVLVVFSEMGRTPALNAGQGKDHWPYTSVMITGPGLTGSRVVGGWDERYYGRGVDPATGDLREESPLISAEVLGATLLALADQDPAEALPGVEALRGILA